MGQIKPILFNTEMVKAILDGRKTVTRRVAGISNEIPCGSSTDDHEFVPDNFNHIEEKATGFVCKKCGFGVAPPHSRVPCGESLFRPRYWPGDILYVRETWCDPTPDQSGYPILYKADMPMHWDAEDVEIGEEITLKAEDYKWRPSIHMPKEAARIFLRVTVVRVERLQSITADDAMNEGFTDWNQFVALWDGTIPKHPNKFKSYPYYWKDNPWVWVIKFERISKEDRYDSTRSLCAGV